jgi:hypothetical protein
MKKKVYKIDPDKIQAVTFSIEKPDAPMFASELKPIKGSIVYYSEKELKLVEFAFLAEESKELVPDRLSEKTIYKFSKN